MLKTIIAAASLVFLASAYSAQAATYNIAAWPADLDKVPCDAWKHNDDGSWTQTGTIIAGNATLTGNTVKGGKESKMLDAKCGKH
jgi:hypothetical protein